MWSLKSSNFDKLISSGPCPGLTRTPSSTFQAALGFSLSGFQPLKSLPLNRWTGLSHVGVPVFLRDGARCPVHAQLLPSGPFTVPTSCLPASFPSNTRSLLLDSSSFGETNVSLPPVTSTFGRARAFPQRPTICAFSLPPSSDTSSQDGYSRSGAFSVKSQRPRKRLAEAAVSPSLEKAWPASTPNAVMAIRSRRNLIIVQTPYDLMVCDA